MKETRLDGKQDPHRRTLWETALYAQSGDIRNDETHIWAQRVVQRAGMTDQMRQFSNTSVSADTYYGMYPETHKEVCSYIVTTQEMKEISGFIGLRMICIYTLEIH